MQYPAHSLPTSERQSWSQWWTCFPPNLCDRMTRPPWYSLWVHKMEDCLSHRSHKIQRSIRIKLHYKSHLQSGALIRLINRREFLDEKKKDFLKENYKISRDIKTMVPFCNLIQLYSSNSAIIFFHIYDKFIKVNSLCYFLIMTWSLGAFNLAFTISNQLKISRTAYKFSLQFSRWFTTSSALWFFLHWNS